MSGWSVLEYLRSLNGRADLTHRERAVLTCHALHADATGRTFVGPARIAEEAVIDLRDCQKVRAALVRRGWLVPTGTHRGRRGDYVVHALNVPSEVAEPPGVAPTGVAPAGVAPMGPAPTLPPGVAPALPPGVAPAPIGSVCRPSVSGQSSAPPDVDLRAPGPPGDLPGKASDPFYAAIWLDALRSVGLLAPDVRLSPRETKDATRIARELGGDRDRIEATGRWIRESRAFEASRAREHVERGSLRWLLGDWAELDRLAHANGHRAKPRRETADEMEARLTREAQQRRTADG